METKAPCDRCGEPATVHIRDGDAGREEVRNLCLACADEEDRAVRFRKRRLDASMVCVVIGLLVLLTSLLADPLAFGSSEGFGWQQWTGVGIALVLTTIGAIIQAPTLLVIGLTMGLVTLMADWVGFGNSSGFGWQQELGVATGLVLVVAGLAGRSAIRRADNRPA